MSYVGDPFKFAEAVTPSDVTNLTNPARGLWVGGTGAVSVEMYGGGTAVFSGIPAGTLLPVQCTRVNATGTTASLIVAGS
jgi:hypothetical protein